MRIKLNRYACGAVATLGQLTTDKDFSCYTLEDFDRKLEAGGMKVPGQTCIPRGTYKVIVTFSNRFKRPLPLLLGVPQFDGIRIHPGNTDADTDGCILVGSRPTTPNFLPNSRTTFDKLFALIEAAAAAGEAIALEVT